MLSKLYSVSDLGAQFRVCCYNSRRRDAPDHVCMELIGICFRDSVGKWIVIGARRNGFSYVISHRDFCFIYPLADMQKFPLRMKDNDLLVTELYKDQNNDHITAISVYLTPKITSKFRCCLGRKCSLMEGIKFIQ